MRLNTPCLIISALVAAPYSAQASKCVAPSDERAMFNYFGRETSDHSNDFVFVFMDAHGSYDPSQTIPVTLDPNAAVTALPAEVLSRAEKNGGSVQVYHRNFSAYVIPIASTAMKSDFQPARDCSKATASNRVIGRAPTSKVGCEKINLSAVSAGTILYDQAANSCSTFNALSGKLEAGIIKKGSTDEKNLIIAIQSLNDTFGTNNKIGDFTGSRKPGFSEIIYNLDKSHKSQEIGTSRTESGGAKKKRHTVDSQ